MNKSEKYFADRWLQIKLERLEALAVEIHRFANMLSDTEGVLIHELTKERNEIYLEIKYVATAPRKKVLAFISTEEGIGNPDEWLENNPVTGKPYPWTEEDV